MAQRRYPLAEALGEKAAKHQLERDRNIEKERKELLTFLKNWWDGWKPKLEAEAAKGNIMPTAKVALPQNVRQWHTPTSDEIRAALPAELLSGFSPDRVYVWMENTFDVAVIRFSINADKEEALKRMKAGGSEGTAELKVKKKMKTEVKKEVKEE